MSLRRAIRNARKATGYGLHYPKILPQAPQLSYDVTAVDAENGTVTLVRKEDARHFVKGRELTDGEKRLVFGDAVVDDIESGLPQTGTTTITSIDRDAGVITIGDDDG